MPSQPLLPALLSIYLNLPLHGALDLVTGTLGASPNWLLLRLIAAALKGSDDNATVSASRTGVIARVKIVLGIKFQDITIIDALDTGLGLSQEPNDADAISIAEDKILGALDPSSIDTPASAQNQKPPATVVILDGLDFLLAATTMPVQSLHDLVSTLRAHPSVNNVIITACADGPLMQNQTTPLEIAHASLVMGLAHQARLVMSVRELDTGNARDVSGVLRVTKGGGWEEEGEAVEQREVLYFVGNDGGVKVFERGG